MTTHKHGSITGSIELTKKPTGQQLKGASAKLSASAQKLLVESFIKGLEKGTITSATIVSSKKACENAEQEQRLAKLLAMVETELGKEKKEELRKMIHQARKEIMGMR